MPRIPCTIAKLWVMLFIKLMNYLTIYHLQLTKHTRYETPAEALL